MTWNLEYVTPVEKWLNKLTNDQLASVAKELELLKICGNELELPHSKYLGEKLFELRERKFGYRMYYIFWHAKIILLLQASDKSSQKRNIVIARRRMKSIQQKEQTYANKKLSKVY